ncbi:MAG: 16S rRNA (adenine(1518)-N(6)/adenine(1519)-N(6))-dimethyltransferase RsmA [Gammaproteobacteria bacterium]
MSHTPRKRFGQHFLHDPAWIARIVRAINPAQDDLMVEIGPGQGALTAPLLEQLDTLHAVELDRDLAEQLRQRFPGGQLILHSADALGFDFEGLATPSRSLRIVGNLPYNISTPLLFRLLEQRQGIADMHFMLQREVVERMAAAPGSKRYGRLTVMLNLHASVEPLLDIGPGAFKPPPRVWSSVVRLVPRATPLAAVADEAVFAKLVTSVFSQRRKTLANGLKHWLSKQQILSLGVDPGVRGETLPVEAFAALANLAHTNGITGGRSGHE